MIWRAAAAAAVLIGVFGFEFSPASAQAPDGNSNAITVEGLFLGRGDPTDVAFTGLSISGPPFVPFSTGDLDPEFSGGGRASIELALWGMPMQFTAFVALPFEGERTIFDPDEATDATYTIVLNAGADLDTSNSQNLFALEVRQRTVLAGSESTYLFAGAPGWRTLAGTRSIYFGEELKSTAFDDDTTFAGVDNLIDRVSIETDNFLSGVQVGVEGLVEAGDGVRWGGSLKGGLFVNFASRERRFSSDNLAGNTLADEIDDTAFAQAVELRPRLEWDVADGTTLVAGGTVLWINGVSEAASHYAGAADFDDNDVRAEGDVLFYGGSVGFTFRLN